MSFFIHQFGHTAVAYWGGDTNLDLDLLLPLLFLLLGGITLFGAPYTLIGEDYVNLLKQRALKCNFSLTHQ